MSLVRMIEETGVSAIAVHGRTRDERPRHENHDDIIAEVAKVLTIPVIAKLVQLSLNYYSRILITRTPVSRRPPYLEPISRSLEPP